MKYAIVMDENKRIRFATLSRFAQRDAVPVDALPEGDIRNYRYEGGRFVLDPLPEQESGQTNEERLAALEAQNEMLVQCVLELSELVYA